MWIFWNEGFMSVVEAWGRPGESEPHEKRGLVARFRNLDDAKRFARTLDVWARCDRKVTSTPKADYPFRVMVPRDAFARWLAAYVTRELNYDNYKNEVAKRLPYERSSRINALHRIWAIMRNALDPRDQRAEHPADMALRLAGEHKIRR